ncbi:MAG TPA: hypothetical protein DCW68_01845 [Rhodospirillaceae bacterium]|nr:MAG: hypothetical protein A2018_04810 [Alphaproteobacteria bacterium GWF2_58_20]HAU28839.1 hypothetical protein [Rhodospirillaceae bacterium]
MIDRIQKSFLLGACGDCLGAPIEGVRSLEEIRALYGPEGLDRLVESMSHWGDVEGVIPAGQVTDDTTMAMTTASALVLACQKAAPDSPDFTEIMRHFLWQGYLQWGSRQLGGEALAEKCDPAIAWPDVVKAFWFPCGAGRGTIAALHEDAPGSVAQPLAYAREVRGRMTRGPNPGCGGMMRVVPLAFLPGISSARVFELACENAALTHGNQTAFVATGAVALFVHFAAMDRDWLNETRKVMQGFLSDPLYAEGICNVLAFMDKAEERFRQTPHSLDAINALPAEIGVRNPFLAGPVLAQVVYAVLCAQRGAKHALVIAANHGGDSDSVAAIVGNVLGAADMNVPPEWGDVLVQRVGIMNMAKQFCGIAPERMQYDRKETPYRPHWGG